MKNVIKQILIIGLIAGIMISNVACGNSTKSSDIASNTSSNSKVENTKPKETVELTDREDIEKVASEFYSNLKEATSIIMTSYMNGNRYSTMIKDNTNLMYRATEADDFTYFFIKDNTKYYLNNTSNGPQKDESYYDMVNNSIESIVDLSVMNILTDLSSTGMKLDYSATQSDDSLIIDISGTTSESESGGTLEKFSYVISGTCDENKNVTSLIIDTNSGENSNNQRYEFSYNDIYVEIPDLESIEINTKGFYAVSPYATYDEIIKSLGKDETLNPVIHDDKLYVIANSNDRYYQLATEITSEVKAEIDKLDILNSDYNNKLNNIIKDLEIEECIDITDNILPQFELDSYINLTVDELQFSGFEKTGWVLDGTKAKIYFDKDLICYEAEVSLDDSIDTKTDINIESFKTSEIKSLKYNSIEPAAIPFHVGNNK